MSTNFRHFSTLRRGVPALLGFLLFCGASAFADVPTITSLSPNTVLNGSSAFTLVVNGTNFDNTAAVLWNGAVRATTFVSATKVTASIPATDVAAAGTANVAVSTTSGTSNAQTFTVSASAVPAIINLIPGSVKAGSGNFVLTVTGSGFTPSSVVQWNGSGRTTNFFSSGTLEAQISGNDVSSPGTADVTVVTGVTISNTTPFSIAVNAAPPTITSLSPQAIAANGPAFTLVVTGTNFSLTSVVQWNGSARDTTFVNSTTLNAAIPASDITQASTASITVVETAPGGATSNAVSFTVNPFSTLFFPQIAVGGGYTTTFTVTNLGGSTANGTLNLTSQSGSPLLVILQDTSTGTQIVSSSLSVTVPPGATRVYVASPRNASDSATSGWARIDTSNGSLGGVATFRLRERSSLESIAGVLSAAPQGSVTIPVDNDTTQGRFTGFAVANPGNTNINISVVTLSSEGAILDTITPPELNPLQPQRQISKFLHELVSRTDFRGSMALIVQGGSQAIVTALVVEQGELTAIPVLPGKSTNIP